MKGELNNGALQLLKGSHALGRIDHWTLGDQQGLWRETVHDIVDDQLQTCFPP